ncbi:hypothetical protein SKAU_G00347390 [Synaphobranchus kaupii]|uniref:Uncharacterized protein n=1 Tax=Synaphobranchus kaupii TaxID=118154 RepID=A0A9Q1EJR1_SYNKA|nr:hypothetical protein SKAU_G00347390 [Synaphobranchus kaupii]
MVPDVFPRDACLHGIHLGVGVDKMQYGTVNDEDRRQLTSGSWWNSAVLPDSQRAPRVQSPACTARP